MESMNETRDLLTHDKWSTVDFQQQCAIDDAIEASRALMQYSDSLMRQAIMDAKGIPYAVRIDVGHD